MCGDVPIVVVGCGADLFGGGNHVAVASETPAMQASSVTGDGLLQPLLYLLRTSARYDPPHWKDTLGHDSWHSPIAAFQENW